MIDMKHMNHAMRATSKMDLVQLYLVDLLNPSWIDVIGLNRMLILYDKPDQQFGMKLNEVSLKYSH